MSERVALVTGASGSLGREVVRVLGTAGWRVLGQVHRSSGRKGEAECFSADLTTKAGADALSSAVSRSTDVLHAIVNCAAVISFAASGDFDEASWDRQWAVNVKAPLFVATALRPQLQRAGDASVVLVSSVTAVAGATSVAVEYVATKGAVASMVLTMAKSWRRSYGIRVNGVMPGPFESDAVDRSPSADMLRDLIRTEGLPDVRAIAEVIEFLVSSRSSAVNGAMVNASGGFVMRL